MTSASAAHETRTDPRDPAVARLLARHDRQSADQRDGPGNGPGVPGSHQTLSRPTSRSGSWSSTARSTITS